MARWQIVVGSGASAAAQGDLEMTYAKQRQFTWRLDDSAEASWTMDARNPEAANVDELQDDAWVYRNGTMLFRGRIANGQDTIDADRHMVRFTARDYREMLNRRIVDADTAFTTTDQSSIAWTLINAVQARAFGNLGITRGVGQTTGVNRTVTYQKGSTIAATITDLGNLSNGFEWEIDPTLNFNVYYPTRGVDNGAVLAYGANVRSVQRVIQPQYFANVVYATGASGLNPDTETASDLATDPRGRWETSYSFNDVTDQAQLAAAASDALAVAKLVPISYTVTLEDSVWGGPADFWIGDTVRLTIRSGRLNTSQTMRVSELQVSLNENGQESVQATMALTT